MGALLPYPGRSGVRLYFLARNVVDTDRVTDLCELERITEPVIFLAAAYPSIRDARVAAVDHLLTRTGPCELLRVEGLRFTPVAGRLIIADDWWEWCDSDEFGFDLGERWALV